MDRLKKHVAKALKEAREKGGLTQQELAKKAGINSNAYAKIERGSALPELDTLEKLAKALGVTSSDILPF